MKKAYYLSSCNTCIQILQEFKNEQFVLQDLKSAPVTPKQLDQMFALTSSYESLFSKRALKYKRMGLKDKNLTEQDFKGLLLEEYTFLKRPVFMFDEVIFIGNSKKVLMALNAYLSDE